MKELKPPVIKEILKIGLDQNSVVIVHGQIADKKLCMHVIGDALKAIAAFEPSKIVKPRIQILKH